MYPPRKQSESVEEESNRVQGAWIFAIVLICLGVVSILCFHDFLWGSSKVLLGVVLATDEVLVKKAVPKKWRLLFKISTTIIYLALVAPLFFRK